MLKTWRNETTTEALRRETLHQRELEEFSVVVKDVQTIATRDGILTERKRSSLRKFY